MRLKYPSENLSNMNASESVRTKMERMKQLEVNPKFPVYRIPYILNHIYFTHDFWLDSDNLIVMSAESILKVGTMKVAKHQILAKIRFFKDSRDCEIIRMSPPEIQIDSVVLSHDKQFVVISGNRRILVVRVFDFSIESEFLVDYPDYYKLGQLALTADDRGLLYPVYLNTDDLNPPKKTKNATFMVFHDLHSGKRVEFGHRSYPWMWSHTLGHPTNPHQLSSALVKFTKYFPQTSECHQRLWLWDISNPAEITNRSLYNQRKKGIFPRYELITHESWGENGDFMTFVVRRHELKRIYFNHIRSQIIMNSGPNPWHCDGRKEDWVVFDTMNKDTGIYIARTNNSELIRLCKQHTTSEGQMFHPHPIFNPNKKYVLFNGNVNGVPNLFRVQTPFD